MIYDNLFDEVLIQPSSEDVDNLIIISGYATSAMAFHHIQKLKEISKSIRIKLLVGMCPTDGVSLSNHKGFNNIISEYSDLFSCSYIYKSNPVHSKLYIWRKGDSIRKTYIGSANYTQNAFVKKNQMEVLAELHSNENVMDYYRLIEENSIFCNHSDTEELVKIYNDKNYYRPFIREEMEATTTVMESKGEASESVSVSLLSKRTGNVHTRAGLNWGQRPGRDSNQAYLQLSPDVYHSDFFPKKPQHFTVITDDNRVFICTRAQKGDEGQAIETPHNNSLLGEYFRFRLNLENGAFVNKEDLENYGRTDVTFYKLDEENFYMDFSV